MQQQYRVNYVLLIILFVIGVVGSGAAYGLWKFQMTRHAGTLLDAAIVAEEEGDTRTAVQYLASYCSFRPDDFEARVKLANGYADLSEKDDVSIAEIGKALGVLEDFVRKFPEEKELRKRLIELFARVGRVRDALDHVDLMLVEDPDNGELLVMKAQYLAQSRSEDEAIACSYDVIGYDMDNDEFDAELAKAPESVQTYTGLAFMLRNRKNDEDLADRVMDQMIEANPKSAEAYLRRGQYYATFDDDERAESDIEEAYELDSENADVLLAMSELASEDDQIDRARELLESGKAKYPQDNRFYQALALLELKNEAYEKALEHVDEGLETIEGRNVHLLVVFKGDLQFRVQDLDGVRETVEKMRELGFRPQYIGWTEARILLAEGKWYRASEALSRLRAETTELTDLSTQINFQLAFCYEQLGRYELARDSYTRVLQQSPSNEPAQAGLQRVNLQLGQSPKETVVADEEQQQSWQQEIANELRKPKEEQNWPAIDKKIDASIKEAGLDELAQKLVWANLYLIRGENDKARQFLQEAHKLAPADDPAKRLPIQRLAVMLVLRDPEQGPEKALPLLDRAISQFGDQPALRLDKADILIAQRGDQLTEQLSELLEGTDDWDDQQKLTLWNGLANKFLLVGMSEQAKQCLKNIVDKQPENLQTRRMLFLLALDTNDDVGMQEAQQSILEVINDKQDSLWQFTEARRLLSLYRRGRLGKESLTEARHLIQDALVQRPEWHDLYLAKAELELASGDEQAALEDYTKAEALGPINPSSRLNHIRLLMRSGRAQLAREQAEKFPEASRIRLMGQLYAEILLGAGDVKDALATAREVLKLNADNASGQLWFGQFAVQCIESGNLPEDQFASVLGESESAMERCVELAPDSSEAWTALVTIRALSKDEEGANEALRRAQLSLGEDQLLLFLARAFEIMGRWFDAENMYKTAYEADPDNYRLMQFFASFYLGRAYPLTDGPIKATPLINSILRAGAENKLPPNDPGLLWARRTAADIFAATRSYSGLIKAENLLSSNAQKGVLPKEDQLGMARILAIRPEPVSRVKAVSLLEAVKEDGRLSPSDQLTLGRLYFGLNQWSQCRSQMQETIALYPDWTAPRKNFIRMLIQRGSPRELRDADTQIREIMKLDQNDLEAIELAVRLSTKLGRTEFARGNLLKLLPKIDDPKKITPQQVQEFELIANLLIGLKEYEEAEKIYRLLAAFESERDLTLAEFLGRYRGADQGFELLNQIYEPDRTIDVVRIALGTARLHRDEVGDKYDANMQQWLDRALRENPESTQLLILQAELYDLEQEYEKAVGEYEKLLVDEELKGPERAIVLNNLSYMAALLGDKVQTQRDPLTLVQEAVQILGPTSAILDTRAVVHTSQKNYSRAIEDLDLSIADDPTPVKYFHKVVAHLGAGENQAAVQAWEKAVELGLNLQELDRMERDRFEDIKSQIEQLSPQSVPTPQAAPLSAAG